ncbi:MAG: FG-GAP-like repeat-containing protein [Caldilineaceae bacterium]
MNLPWNHQRRRASQQSRTITLFAVITFAVFQLWTVSAYGAVSQPTVVEATLQTNATSQLFFPVYYDKFVDGNRTWQSTLSLQNTSISAATAQLVFYNSFGIASTNTLNLAAGQAQIFSLNSSPSGPGATYAVVVNSDQPLAGVNWTRLSTLTTAPLPPFPTLTTVSHGADLGWSDATAKTLYLPAVAKNTNGFTSNLTIQNLSNSALNGVTLTFYNQNGNQVLQQSAPSISPYSSWYPNLAQMALADGYSGSVIVSSPNGPVAVIDNKVGSDGSPLLTTNGMATGSQTLYAPGLSTNSNFSTELTVYNTSSQTAAVNVTHSDNAGNSQFNLPAHGSQTLSYPSGTHGNFAATLTADRAILALVTIRNSTAGTGYAYNAFTQASTSYFLPLQLKGYQNNSISFSSTTGLFNPGSAQADVQFFYSNGSTRQATIQPGQTLGVSVNTDNTLPTGFTGAASVTSSEPLLALTNIVGSGTGGDFGANYPGWVSALPPVNISKTANADYLKAGEPLTYTLSFAAGSNGGSAQISDLLPNELLTHTFSTSAGLVVTQTGALDYQWDAEVPAAGGIITVTGVVDPAIVTDTLLVNTAVITAADGTASTSKNVLIDVTPPDTTILAKPNDPSSITTPSFQFAANDGNGSGLAGFACQLDSGGWQACSTFYVTAALSDGLHTFEVQASDKVGQVDPTPATYSWTVDATAPAAPALIDPSHNQTITDRQTITLSWQAVTATDLAGYKLKFNGNVIDAGNVTDAAVGPLANGTYTWTVATYDALNNTSPFTDVVSFTLNVDVPQVVSFAPLANSHAATLTTAIALTLSHPIDAASVHSRTFAVYGMQSGQRLHAYNTNGATLTFTPNQPFKPGEWVQVSAATGLQDSNGFGLLPPLVWQFRNEAIGGSGYFTVANSFGSNHAADEALGDVDSDGDVDMVVADYGGTSKLYLNDGDGTFDTTNYSLVAPTGGGWVVRMGDLNGDGKLDLVLGSVTGFTTIYLNDGSGNPFDSAGSTYSLTVAPGSFALALGDVDGDGDLDLATERSSGGSLLLNDGDGNPFDTTFYNIPLSGDYFSDITFGDVNGDYRLDLLVVGSNGNKIYLNDGKNNPFDGISYSFGTFSSSSTKFEMTAGDFNGDQRLDVAVSHRGSPRQNIVYLNDGSGNPFDTLTNTVGPAGICTTALTSGDVDDDGDLDLALGNWGNGCAGGGQTMVYLNDGDGSFDTTSYNVGVATFANMVHGLEMADLDGDGDLDLTAAIWGNTPQLSYLNLNEVPSPTPTPTLTPSLTPTPILPTATPINPTNTPVPPTVTPVDTPATPTDTPIVPTATPVIPTNTPAGTPATPTDTPVAPTATAVIPTDTQVSTPATVTATPIPPTATLTPIPGTPTATPTLPVSDATTVAQPDAPATLTYSDPNGGSVAVQIPAGAIDQATTFLYDDQGAPSQPGAFQFAGRTFTLTAYRDNSPQSGFTFQQPVTLVIEYTDSDVAGIDENDLRLFFFNTTTNSWSDEGIVVVSRDPAGNRITVQISHLTEFAMGSAKYILLPIIRR